MTPEQQAAFRVAVRANSACNTARAQKNCDLISAIMSAGRTKSNGLYVGYGTIVATIGRQRADHLMDILFTNVEYRYARNLIEQGRLEIGNPEAQQTIRSFVLAGYLTQPEVNALCALGLVPDPYPVAEVHLALFHPDGTEIL